MNKIVPRDVVAHVENLAVELAAARAIIDAMREVLETDEFGGYHSDLWGAMRTALETGRVIRYR